MPRTTGVAIGLLAALVLTACATGTSDAADSPAPAAAHRTTPPVESIDPVGPAPTSDDEGASAARPADGADTEPLPEPESLPEPEPLPEVADEQPAPADPSQPAPDGTATTAEQQAWLEHQQIVRDCMAEAGQEYLFWEWWSNAGGAFAAMPTDLTEAERAAWELALHGDTGLGADYRWEDAGCWGLAAEVTGSTN